MFVLSLIMSLNMIKKLFVSFIRLAILQIFWQAVMRLFFVNNKLVIRLILKIKLKVYL